MSNQIDVHSSKTMQAHRVVAGHCPKCKQVVVVFNNYETWPLVECVCGWQGGTLDIDNHVRLEREGRIEVRHQMLPSETEALDNGASEVDDGN